MTIVIAQKKGDQILLLADTKIGNAGETGPNVIPGRLKLAILDNTLTIGFAGNADAAGIAVRRASEALRASGEQAAIDLVRAASADGQTDYIIAAHKPHAILLLLRRGGMLEVPDICAIGDVSPFAELMDKARTDTDSLFKGDLRFRFFDRLLTNKDLGDTVGGFPVAVGASQGEHRYLAHSGFYTFKFPTLKWGEETHQDVDQVYTGDGHFALGVIPPSVSGVPVFGAYSLQGRIGYVYSPLEAPEAFRVQLWPNGQPWEGHEQKMFATLRRELEKHVDAVTAK
ncbi:hypothetical protein [Rhizobium fabae]|uniref:Uncharacterized protein n=1 Tax=Rhizobium fabae TaxID=573179 RepID=A0A7W6BBV3_9HYPH|nr:hypothetical protein [Rhizobium fabae]MBB3917713.1 hypothetical protein [Rhizobium fabae]